MTRWVVCLSLLFCACGDPSVELPDSSFVSTDGGFVCTPNTETNGLEACNGRDDDCNGTADDAPGGGPLRRSCSSQCGKGTERCLNGQWVDCSARQPADEQCDGVDNNCDDQIDEGCDCMHGETRPCGSSEGACREGVQQCINGSWQTECFGEIKPSNETCNNGIDDNCDGDIDEGCQCMPGQTLECGISEGECQVGQLTCTMDGRWGETCEGEVRPSVEVCNGLDDDCDGQVDWNQATNRGWTADRFESNQTCAGGTMLDPAIEDGAVVAFPPAGTMDLMDFPTMYPPGNQDWYRFRAEEVSSTCVPGTSQCAYQLVVQLALEQGASPEDYEFCLSTTQNCNEIDSNMGSQLLCTTSDMWVADRNSYAMAVKWGGVCGRDDSRDVHLVVRSPTGRMGCGFYRLYTSFRLNTNEACP